MDNDDLIWNAVASGLRAENPDYNFLRKHYKITKIQPESPPVEAAGVQELCNKCKGNGSVNEPGKSEKHFCEFCAGTGYKYGSLIEELLLKYGVEFDTSGLIVGEPPTRFGEIAAAFREYHKALSTLPQQDSGYWKQISEQYVALRRFAEDVHLLMINVIERNATLNERDLYVMVKDVLSKSKSVTAYELTQSLKQQKGE